MGATSELHIRQNEDLIARIEMPYWLYVEFKEYEHFEEFKLLKVRDTSISYKDSKEWLDVNKTLKEAAILKEEIESNIRIDKALQNES